MPPKHKKGKDKSTSKKVTEKPNQSNPRVKLTEDQISNLFQHSSDKESDESSNSKKNFGKNQSNVSNYNSIEDGESSKITMKFKRMSDQISYKVTYYEIGETGKKSTSNTRKSMPSKFEHTPTRPPRSCKDNVKNYNEDKMQSVTYAGGKKHSIIFSPDSPGNRKRSVQSDVEKNVEVDENDMQNANQTPKRSKPESTPRKSNYKNTPKKSLLNAMKYNENDKLPKTPKKNLRVVTNSPTKAMANLNINENTPKRNLKIKDELNTRSTRSSRSIKKLDESEDFEDREDSDKEYKPDNLEESEDDTSEGDETEDESMSEDSYSSSIYSPQKRTKHGNKTLKKARISKTPKRPETPKSFSNISLHTPTKQFSRLSLGNLTPSMHRRTMNIVKPRTPLQEARHKLHVSILPKSLPCREEQFNEIYSFLNTRLSDGSGGCIYISGVPGTGKTATVNEVIRCLNKAVDAGKLSEFQFIDINGMKLSKPQQAYVQIWKQLTGDTLMWEPAQKMLHERFTKSNPNRGMTLLLVDELDLLCTKRQDVIYNLLDWPSKSTAKLVVVTIANTMDLPERILMGKVTSRLGLTRLTFPPYNHKQLEEIVVSRLKGYDAFGNETVQLVARKVAAVSGDARRALDICRRATEVAEMNGREMVSMIDVKKALDEMIASPKVQAIKHCSDFEKIFLQAVCAEVNRTGVEEVVFKNVYFQLETLCSINGEKIPNSSEALSICARLGSWRLLLCDHSRMDIHQRLLLNVSTDDVHFATQDIAI